MDKFLTFPDRAIGDDGRLFVPEPDKSDVVEVPQCGFWTVTWTAVHPQRGTESGTMLVARHDATGPRSRSYATNIVAEILWGRGFTGSYDVAVVEGA